MTTISYRDALSDIITDAEELEFLLEYVDMHKNWGAFRTPKLPSHTLVTLIDAVKRLKEQQIGFYQARSGATTQDATYDKAAATPDVDDGLGE